MMPTDYSISELSAHVGIPVRTIRSYVQQGLIPGPNSLGRGARYSEDALDRLFAIKAFREVDGISMEEIRARFLTLSRREIAEKADPYRNSIRPETEGSGINALDYLDNLRNAMGGSWAGDGMTSSAAHPSQKSEVPGTSDANDTPVDRALSRLATLSQGINSRRTAKADPWIRFPINADIEIHVRGTAVGGDKSKYELLADYIREALLGESNT
jgi:DNA-binding transcriptional MerR regulator